MVGPIDGTAYFVSGLEGFAGMVGLLSDGIPVLVVMRDPKNDVTYSAMCGGSAFRQRVSGSVGMV